MPMIETYFHGGPGYDPLLICDGWQVAQLGYLPELAARAIRRIERHAATDEVFILVRGESVLCAAVEGPGGLRFETCRMRPGVTCNIPAGVWHSIAMTPADLVVIVEKPHTHLHDVEYRELGPQECEQLQSMILEEEGRHEGDDFTRTLHDGAPGRHRGPHSGSAADVPVLDGDRRDQNR